MNNIDNNNNYNYINSLINKSYLILDQIHESYFSHLEKLINLLVENSTIKIDKNIYKEKIFKIEFIIQQRIMHVVKNCEQLDSLIKKLSNNEINIKNELINRIEQLRSEQKRIWSSFKRLQHKRVEKERLQKEQEESLTRRFISSTTTPTTLLTTTTSTFDNDNQDNITLNIDNCNINCKNNNCNCNDQYSPTNKSLSISSSSLPLSHSSSSSSHSLIRHHHHQRPLVKRVRTRYLNFITNDFWGLTSSTIKTILRSSSSSSLAEWLLLLALCLIFIGLFFLIIWQTSLNYK